MRAVRLLLAICLAVVLPACDIFKPDPVVGCTDSAALNYSILAEEDNGSCEFSRVVFYGGQAIAPQFLPWSVVVDGVVVGQVTGFYPGAPPGNCSAQFTAQMQLSDGRRHDWNASSPGNQFANSGVVQASRSNDCIRVRVF